MTKAKIALAAICLFAGIGGAVAFKARATQGYIITTTSPVTRYTTVTLAGGCKLHGTNCKFTAPNELTYQVYQYSAPAGTYYPVRLQ